MTHRVAKIDDLFYDSEINISLRTHQMAIILQTKTLTPLPQQVKHVPLTLGGQRCKEQLSGIPSWVQRANGSNVLWNNLAASAFNIYN